jgi:hypothetical protein
MGKALDAVAKKTQHPLYNCPKINLTHKNWYIAIIIESCYFNL